MAKKKVVIIDEELVPTVLEVKKDKKKASIFGVIWIFFIFAILIAGAYYLPEIANYVNSYINPEAVKTTSSNTSKQVEEEEEDEPQEEITEYYLSTNPTIKTDNFSISFFNINDNTISFVITNLSDTAINLSDYNYFLNLLDENKTLLQRIMIQDGVITPNGNLELSFSLTNGSVSIVSLQAISPLEYPTHVVPSEEGTVATLVCKKDNETVTYYLADNKATLIQDNFEVSIYATNYATLYTTWSTLSLTYNNLNGITSTLTTENDTLMFRTIINLDEATNNSLNSKIYYAKDTDAKIMYFELSASGYSCN